MLPNNPPLWALCFQRGGGDGGGGGGCGEAAEMGVTATEVETEVAQTPQSDGIVS